MAQQVCALILFGMLKSRICGFSPKAKRLRDLEEVEQSGKFFNYDGREYAW